jgi:FKBP-type peptidyl-prolyl cis-trans isomerase
MTLGEKAELTISAEYAYGMMGSPPSIPGNATLIFTIELL